MPDYYRHDVTPGIVHLGVGGFSRSHFNLYTDSVLHKDPSWGIIGAGLMKNDERMQNILRDQDFMYTCVTKGSDDCVSTRVSGSMVDYIWAG
jgi:mannitol 2-dehydrogenase